MIITPHTIADAIGSAPAWAQIALTVPQERLREDARLEVARHLYTALYQPVTADAGQLQLPF